MSAIVGTVFCANEDFNSIQNTELTVQGEKLGEIFTSWLLDSEIILQHR